MANKNDVNAVPTEDRTDEARSGIQVIRRAVSVLRVLAGQGQAGLSLGAIASRVELPRSTVQRIVAALEDEGMVVPAPAGGGVCLGPTVGVLARGLESDPVDLFRNEMASLHARLNESIALNTLAGGRVGIIENQESTKPLRAVFPKVETVDLLTSAPGKAILAILPDAAREAAIALAGTSFDRAKLEAELAAVRSAGYAIEEDQPYEGISGLAIALLLNDTPYAITVLLPTTRFPVERAGIAEALLDSARALAHRLSGS